MGELEEACPDIEVIVTIREDGKIRNSLEISINKSRFVRELKQSLAMIPEVGIHPKSMSIFTGDTELDDDMQIMMYDIETDDEIFLDNLTRMTSKKMAAVTTTPKITAIDNAV